MAQKLIFSQQSDGSFRRNNSTATAYQPTLLGSLDSYYSAATLNAANTAIAAGSLRQPAVGGTVDYSSDDWMSDC